MKKILIAIIACFILLASGCANAPGATQTDDAVTAAVSSEEDLQPTPSPAAPTPVPSYAAYENPDDELLAAPDIPGTEKAVQERTGLKRVVYLALADNAYGLEEGAYAGEYKKNVSVDGTETGGVALVGAVAEVLLNDALATIPAGEPRVKVALPMDIAEAGEDEVTVKMDDYAINMACDTALTVLWMVPGSELLYIGVADKGDYIYDVRNTQYVSVESDGTLNIAQYFQLADGEMYELPNNPMTNDNMMLFLQLYVTDGAIFSAYGPDLQGFAYVKTSEKIPNLFGYSAYDDPTGVCKSVSLSCRETRSETRYTLTPEDLLLVGGLPVFLTAE